MNYVVHFYHYPDYVVFCKTIEEVKAAIQIKDTASYKVYVTNDNMPAGAEMATWAWELFFHNTSHKRKVVEF